MTPLSAGNASIPSPPCNTEAEQALLGAILVNNVAYGRVAKFLAPEHFGYAVHGRIYAAAAKLIERGQIANPVTLKNLLDQDGALAANGGAAYLVRLAESAVTIINAEHYGRTIHDLHLRRELIAIGQDIITEAFRHDLDDLAREQIERAASRLLAIRGRAGLEPAFVGTLSAAAWLDRKIPKPDFLMGEVFSTTSRAMMVADTGLGKTSLALALAFAMALGRGFLHWGGCGHPVRVMYVDGEMARRLLKARLADAARRADAVPATLHILCRDEIEEMPPLNMATGQQFIDSVIAGLSGIDFVIFDNVQALLLGDMKDEEPWQQTLPWIRRLTARSIGQLWIHHTGHDTTRSYGTKTREWQLDAVMLAEPIERLGADIAFALKFTKARERAPHNRADFEPVKIRLVEDHWSRERATRKSPSPLGRKFYNALVGALAASDPGERFSGRPAVTVARWKAECVRLRLLDGKDAGGRDRDRALFNKYRRELIARDQIACNNETVWTVSDEGK